MGRPAPTPTELDAVLAEVTRALALTIAYKVAVDNTARDEVVAAIRDALEFAHAALRGDPR